VEVVDADWAGDNCSNLVSLQVVVGSFQHVF
jgi:hypothetical protein